MTVAEKIIQHIRLLPEVIQTEVLDFVEYLETKTGIAESAENDVAWSGFSLSQAMRGLESEPSIYSTDDLKEVFS
ncbi:MAG: DUF2281 domain-containing protein [bacterium]